MQLLITLGPALIAIKGYTSPEVEAVYNRAYQLCHHVGDVTQRFDVFAGLRRFYMNRGEFRTAREIGEQSLALAQQNQEQELLLEAYWSLGGVLFHLGEFALAQEHLYEAVTIYEKQGCRVEPLRHGTVPGIHCLAWLSLNLWMRGYTDQALQRSEQALTLARQQTSLFALHFVLFQRAMLHQHLREYLPAQEYVDFMQETEAAHRWIHAIPWRYLQGWVLTMQGEVDQGISFMRQQLVELSHRGYSSSQPYALALLAEADAKLDRIVDGLSVLAQGLSLSDTMGAHFYEAELYRLKGQLLLQQSPDNASTAEACFQQAIAIAQHQSAKSWELRAATSLARLWLAQGKRDDAHQLLRDVYDWFTEGFDTADLREAQTLLDELSPEGLP